MNEFFKKPVVKILMLKGEKGDKGNTGTGTPTGGKTGQYLLKKSDADYDYVWSPITTVSWDNVSGKTNATESAAGLMSAEDKSKLDNLQVGGRNLLTNSKGEFSGNYPESGIKDVMEQKNVSLPTDATHFVLSFDAKSTVDGDVIRSHFYSPSNVEKTENSAGQVSYAGDGSCHTTLTTDWKRYWIKWTAPIADTRTVLCCRLFKDEGTGKVSMRNVKFEVGTVPTDWTPAPEDVDSRIDGVDSRIDGVDSRIDGVDSRIDALNSTTKSFTLSASNWGVQNGWPIYVINDSLITSDSNQEVIPSGLINKAQYKALQRAELVGTQKQGVLTLWVYGTVPSIDIPIMIIFRGKI